MPAYPRSRILLQVQRLPEPFRDIQETRYPPGYMLTGGRHSHPFFQAVYVLRGSMELESGTGTRTCTAGEYGVFAPGYRHTWRNTSGRVAVMFNVHVQPGAPGFAEPLRALASLCGGTMHAGSDDGAFTAIADEMAREVQAGRFGYTYRLGVLLSGFLLDLLRRALDKERSTVPAVTRIDRALWYIEQNHARKLSLDDIGASIGVSGKHACDLFRQEMGIAPVAYLNRVRMERARLLLQDGELRVSEIAPMVGIDDEHYFSRLFKKRFGVSPSKYRAKRT